MKLTTFMAVLVALNAVCCRWNLERYPVFVPHEFVKGDTLPFPLLFPAGIDVSAQGDVWVTDRLFNTVHQLNAQGKSLKWYGNGETGCEETYFTKEAARFDAPVDVCCANEGTFIADFSANTIRKIRKDDIVSRFAGQCYGSNLINNTDGPCKNSDLVLLSAIAWLNKDLYLTDGNKLKVIRSTPDTSRCAIQTLFVYENDKSISFNALAGRDQTIYVATGDNKIFKADSNGGNTKEVFIQDNTMSIVSALATDNQGNLYIADSDNKRILILHPDEGRLETIHTMDGKPQGLAYDTDLKRLYFTFLNAEGKGFIHYLQRIE